MIRTIVGLSIVYLFVGQLYAQQCRVQFGMHNQSRHVYGEVATECGGVHSPPWGNWGVDSNVGSRQDGDQFQGIHWTDSKYQWNSCTQGTWEAPNCGYYNWNGCTEQMTVTGINVYGWGSLNIGVSCEYYDWIADEWLGGCKDLDGRNFPFSGNYMDLYELDPWSPDDFVVGLLFNTVWATLDCPDSTYCNPSASPWVQNWNNNGIAWAQIRVMVDTAWYIDDPSCIDD